jgi:threonylcarbamoyladenosine tRNA methylthiotransferase MtaB
VVRDAQSIVGQGIQEVVLTGVNIGDYGKGEFGNKRHEHTFLDLLHALDAVEGLDRIRISSIEPNLLSDEIIDFTYASKRFVPHFHIPLQSGNNEVLGKMKRRYRRELYQERVARILATRPDACIGVDVIVGFPGETEEHFLDTYRFLEQLPIGYLHVFTYSERANTEAVELPGAVPVAERKARNHRLRLLSAIKQREFAVRHEGSLRRVLWETEDRDGRLLGYTENYLRLSRPFDPSRANTVEHVVVGSLQPDGTQEALNP